MTFLSAIKILNSLWDIKLYGEVLGSLLAIKFIDKYGKQQELLLSKFL